MKPPVTRLRTAAVHAGESPDPATGASAPNLVMSSTFVTRDAAGFSAHDLDEESGFLYTRWSNPTVAQLEAKLCALEGAEACLCFGSGMAAATGVLLSLLGRGDHVVMSDTNYAGVAELGRDTLPRMGIGVSFVDASDPHNVETAIRPETRLIWLETPANPICRLTDLAAVARVAAAHPGVRIAVDSTFATPVATRPLELGAHYVMHSLTKYIGGHGDAVGGAVLGTRRDIAALRLEAGIHYGGVLSPFNAWLIMRGAATLPIRMKAHEENALAVARFLESHPRVTRVIYPGLPSHPQHGLARRQMDNFSGMLTFQAADGPQLAERMACELRVIHYAVSLGHHRSLVFWMDTPSLMETSFRLDGAQLESYRAYAGDGIFRMSVGLEDPHDLREDLGRVLG
ncbi:MAG: aminotransferase class I/II-fold pyridoxal phosphate-dependent enzyme [Gemmatimonadetes bacterium]|nr:aminotransferase class I/II-fold pyridoxal phosphate-dependent enzyme [Gemmatimonadota bacterium]MYA42280.1 aminotransferase class I/II-fold pyridoxal phosphate-dependent enzyme [Gemmatimonadota bacterium]